MNKATHQTEQLSALCDGELSYSESGTLLDAVLQEDEARAQLSRYQRYGSYIRGELSQIDHGELFERIHTQLADEPAILAPAALKRHAPTGWKRLVSGGAIAASVAAVLVLGFNDYDFSDQASGIPLAANQQPAEAVVAPSLVSNNAVPVSASRTDEDIQRYIREHEDLISSDSLSPSLPLATMVGYDGY